MEKYSIYLKKFQVAIFIIVAALAFFIYTITKAVPEVQTIMQLQTDYKTQSDSLADAERKLQGLRDDAERKAEEAKDLTKLFFKPISEGLDTEAAISDEFGEILQLIRENKIKTRSVKYDYDPQDDNFVKNAASRFHVCRVSAEMIANYASFANFMRELYKHEHFLEISKIEIVPYEKNKKILLISLQMKLYAQRVGTYDTPATAAPASNTQSGTESGTGSSAVPSPQPVDGGVSPEASQ